MINYLKKNALSFLIGLIIGIPISLYAVSQQQPQLVASERVVEQPTWKSIPDTEPTEQSEPVEQQLNVNIVYEMTPDDIAEEKYYDSLELLACCIEAEAGNQDMYGKRLVCDTVLNRVDDAAFPNNITDVIMQPYAFSVVLDGRINQVSPSDETYEVVREEIKNRTNSKVLFFTAEGYSEYGTDWQKVGDHYFSYK
jgi:N-acetylmuramoyl-L-alanine amidase